MKPRFDTPPKMPQVPSRLRQRPSSLLTIVAQKENRHWPTHHSASPCGHAVRDRGLLDVYKRAIGGEHEGPVGGGKARVELPAFHAEDAAPERICSPKREAYDNTMHTSTSEASARLGDEQRKHRGGLTWSM